MSACIDTSWDHDPPTVSTSKTVRARTVHKCGECGHPIEPGDLYERVTGCWDGSWSTHKTCSVCVLVRSDFFYSWTFGGMVEDFRSAHGFDYRDGIPDDFEPCRGES